VPPGRRVKICDPAIGSGAFPIGLLQEIYWIKLSLDWTLDRAEAKRRIIQHSIYGVDLDAGAVEIARLRFWLALIVDEDKPRPLPNLDYKIMQGDSLLESFEGVDLSHLTGKTRKPVQLLGPTRPNSASSGLHGVTIEFEEASRLKSPASSRATSTRPTRRKSSTATARLTTWSWATSNTSPSARRTTPSRLDNARKGLKRKQAAAPPTSPPEKRDPPRQLDTQLQSTRKRASLAACRKNRTPLLPLAPLFQDVFARGGFDIVIGNPPYISHDRIPLTRRPPSKAFSRPMSRSQTFIAISLRNADCS